MYLLFQHSNSELFFRDPGSTVEAQEPCQASKNQEST